MVECSFEILSRRLNRIENIPMNKNKIYIENVSPIQPNSGANTIVNKEVS